MFLHCNGYILVLGPDQCSAIDHVFIFIQLMERVMSFNNVLYIVFIYGLIIFLEFVNMIHTLRKHLF